MLGRHGSIIIPQNTPYASEMRKHEATYTEFGPGERPFVFREFPKRLYKATRGANGPEFEGFTVNDDHEQRNMQSRGFALSQPLALEALSREHTEHGKLAAERNFEVKNGRISEKAAAEVREAEDAHGARHLPEVPAKPIRRRRGPNKPKVAAE